ncbi:MAG: biopolymer transporter ExbD [Bacteroidales bacterium]|nr:biopolymer transporter ExbD [Bacteroidales bacterium]HNW72324.1 biopolymer transporter ExbD [Bacteroidales bacterium]HPS49583.1 biopolymer transporter ExbD [Bacteroidales bacterium]
MAELIVEEKGKKGGKRRPKKHSTRIDMTPMVDLMCLLITFFMLTTAFSKPKVMVITMPEKDKKEDPKNAPKISAERTLNILLTGNDVVYYYMGMADPKKPPLPTLVKTDFSKDGIRKILLIKNRDLFTRIAEYRDQRITGKLVVADTTADNEIKKMKKEDKKGPIVLIKADSKAKYKDIVNIIDEMAICNIASYAIVDLSPVELEMIKNAPK